MKFLFGIGIRWWNANVFYAAALAEALQEDGEEVLIAVRKGGVPYGKIEEMGLPIRAVDFESANPLKLIRELFALKKLIFSYQPDYLIPATSKAQFLMVLAKILFFRDIKIVRILADVQSPKNTAANRWFYNKWVDFVVTSSVRSQKNAMENAGYPGEKTKVIYLGYPHERFFHPFNKNEMRKKYGIPEKAFIVLNIGRLAVAKSQFTLIEAVAHLKKESIDLTAVISGEEIDFSAGELISRAESLGVKDRIIILPRVDDVRELIAAGDAGIITSVASEVVCRIATEYMIYGLPVVGTDVNVIPEMIEPEKNGYIFRRGDSAALAEVLKKLLKNRELREQMMTANRKKAEEIFSYGYFLKNFKEILP